MTDESRAAPPPVVILCGGRGTRLGADTDVLPKPLVTVGGRPILWQIMSHYARFGLNRFILCLGYKGEQIREYFLNYRVQNNDFTIQLNGGEPRVISHLTDVIDWEVTCADTGLDAQTGARIKRIEKYIDSPYFLCTYGDGVSDVNILDLVDFHRQHGRVATVTGVHPPARWGELVLGEDTAVAGFTEKPALGPRAGAGAYVNGGFFVFNRELFEYLSAEDDCVLERTPLERLAAENQLRIFRHDGFWQAMDVPKDRDMLNELFASNGGAYPGTASAPDGSENGVGAGQPAVKH
jgi:glucose-1-phosphate cytidylyltransferase